jgi:cytochrome c oxidase cbb3-type subunit 2
MVFEISCSPCHGLKGMGDGPLAANLASQPRNLTLGSYKNRSTASGALPTNDDIDRAIATGVHRSAMPGFANIAADRRAALIQYVRSLCERFADPGEYPLAIVPEPPVVATGPESILRGRTLYVKMQCENCHGASGMGDGPSADMQHDDAGNPVHTTDLTNPSDFKFARTVHDVVRIFSTGMNGVPMPSYQSSMTDSERWDLANYVWSLRSERR